MKELFAFLYFIVAFFALVGSIGYLFSYGQPQFAVADIILGAILGLAYFNVVELPNKDTFK